MTLRLNADTFIKHVHAPTGLFDDWVRTSAQRGYYLYETIPIHDGQIRRWIMRFVTDIRGLKRLNKWYRPKSAIILGMCVVHLRSDSPYESTTGIRWEGHYQIITLVVGE